MERGWRRRVGTPGASPSLLVCEVDLGIRLALLPGTGGSCDPKLPLFLCLAIRGFGEVGDGVEGTLDKEESSSSKIDCLMTDFDFEADKLLSSMRC